MTKKEKIYFFEKTVDKVCETVYIISNFKATHKGYDWEQR